VLRIENQSVQALLSLVVTACLIVFAAPPAGAYAEDLPDIGSPAEAAITLEDEYRVGRMIVRGLRDADRIVEDPEVTEYLQTIGHRLASHAHDGDYRFQFFVVNDNSLNAFALPGGFIGVNSGLILTTHDESELAGVMAHEIAHVTQRHIARSIAAQSRQSLVSTAAMLAAILVGVAAGGGDAAMAGMAAAQSLAIQQRISFTRANEYEADRVGIGVLANSGFDPNAMPAFFETMGRRAGTLENQIPEMLRTHPVSSDRIAESRSRAAQYEGPWQSDSLGYAITRERLRVLTTPPGQDPRRYYASTIANEPDASPAQSYGQALAAMTAGDPADAVPVFRRLRDKDDTVLQYHTALGQAQLLAGDLAGSRTTLERARDLFPRNVPVTVRYAETLMRQGDAKFAHEVLLDLFNNVPPTPEQARFIALVANAAGDVGDAYYYMSEYHILGGDLPLAISQLQLALAVPKLTEVQRARFQARLDEIEEYLPKKQRSRREARSPGHERVARDVD
jgi:predicted Zn-dependent protease